MSEVKTGLKTVLAEQVSTSEPVAAPVEQLDLLPLVDASALQKAAEKGAGPRGVGRPPGSKNKNTQEWRDFILGKYTSPLVVLAEAYSRPVHVLAAELKCSLEDAFKLQIAAAKELAPYVHQKMPQAIEAGENGLIHLTINALGGGAQAVESDQAPVVEFIQSGTVENQWLDGQQNADSVAAVSVANEKDKENSGVDADKASDAESVAGGDAPCC